MIYAQKTTTKRLWQYCLTMLGLVALCLMSACAKPVVHAPNTVAPESQAASAWQNYEKYSHAMQSHHAPYRVSASLRYDSHGNGHRVLVYMWSNDEAATTTQMASPLRLDIVAGIGATVGQVREDANSFLMYSPNEEKVYYHQGSRKPLFSLGVPVPLSIADVTDLVLGRFSNIFGTTFNTQANRQPMLEADGDIAYSLLPQGQLILSPEGLVQQWREQSPNSTGKQQGWVLDITYAEPQNAQAALTLPRKLTFTYYGSKGIDHKAIILIKERAYPDQPFTPEQIELQIPQGTPFYPLQNG